MVTRISSISPGLAKAYSASATYVKGNYVLYKNAYWRCKSETSIKEAWNQDHWEKDEAALDKFEVKAEKDDFSADSPADYVEDFVNGDVMTTRIQEVVNDMFGDASSYEFPLGASSDSSSDSSSD